MAISLESLAKKMLHTNNIREKSSNGLYVENAIVLIFDGYSVFFGNLNMVEAIPRLKMLSAILGLPVSVIEQKLIMNTGKKTKKSRSLNRYLGPNAWAKSIWNSEAGLDSESLEEYSPSGIKIAKKESSIVKSLTDDDEWLERYGAWM